jgi:hypothetical protein
MYRTIDTATWDDPWFAELEPDAKLLFLYFITNRRTTACGAFEITQRAMQFETGLDAARLERALAAIASRVSWWPEHQTVWVRNFYKHQRANSNDKFTTSARRALASFAPVVQASVCNAYPELSNRNGIPSVSHSDATPIPLQSHTNKETVTVTEQNREVDLEGEVVLQPAPVGADAPLPTATATNGRSHSTLKAVPKPTPEERRDAIRVQILSPPVLEFAAEHTPFIDVPAEAEKFLDYLAANGKAQKDYPAAFRNWLRKAKEFAPAQRTKTNGTTGYQTASERRASAAAGVYDLLYPQEDDWREPDEGVPAGRPRLAEPAQRGGPQVVDANSRSVGNRAG